MHIHAADGTKKRDQTGNSKIAHAYTEGLCTKRIYAWVLSCLLKQFLRPHNLFACFIENSLNFLNVLLLRT